MKNSETQKDFIAKKATGVSVEDFYAAQAEAAMKVKGEPKYSTGVYINKVYYSCLILARVEPMPTYSEFREWLDEDMLELVNECKKLNPRHFDPVEAEPVDEKKSET